MEAQDFGQGGVIIPVLNAWMQLASDLD